MNTAEDKKDFLLYLLQKNILSKLQLQECLQESAAQQVPLLKILLQKSFLSPQSLSALLEEFKQLSQKNNSEKQTLLLSPQKINSPENSVFETTISAKKDTSGSPNSKRYIASYEILEEIAQGGMAIVYKVRHTDLNQIYALKVIRSESFSPEDLKRFEREAKTNAKLIHPAIVKVFDFGEFDHQYYLCMEYIQGQTLKQKLRESLSIENVIELFIKILDALEYAHQQGILHRDLKPGNIFIDSEENPKIGDFGLAKEMTNSRHSRNLTKTGEILGTPAYMAPEQLVGDSSLLGVSVDIYAIGACLYEILTQQTPFQGQNIHELFYKILSESPEPPSRWNAKIPADLDTIILKTLHKSKERRYPSAKALAEDLKRFLRGERISVKPPHLLENIITRGLKHRNTLILTVFALISGVLVLGYDRYQTEQDQKKEQQRQISTYKNYLKKIVALREKASALSEENTTTLRQKIDLLMEANNLLNLTKMQKADNPQIEDIQYEIGKELIRLLSQQNQYLLARYFSREINTLKNVEDVEKIIIADLIEQGEQKLLLQHQKRFLYWIEQLRYREWKEGLKESALLEISKMQEEPILQQLLTFLNEGKKYFSQNTLRKESEERFYKAMVEALGRLERPSSAEPLMLALEEMSQNVFSGKTKSFSLSEVEYMIELAYSIANSGNRNFAERFNRVREQGRDNELFWTRTEYVAHYFQE
ncbi:MAG: serine/threonine-protein kinase [Planctomycetota bacterium]